MIIKSIYVEQFRAMKSVNAQIGKRVTAIVGRNTTMKTTFLGMLSQPFTIGKDNIMYGEKTLDGYDYRSQFKEKFKLSKEYDVAGTHIWELKFRNNIYNGTDRFKVKSVDRKSKNDKKSLRFINAEKGKEKGHGYVQIPVIYLSLSRLFPIGESGKTSTMAMNLSEEEERLFLSWYKRILAIQNISNPVISVEKKDAKHIFSGVSDDIHTIETSSAGESNMGRILLAILSFKRLADKYGSSYKGGILLIDELDATLHGFSQREVVNLFSKVAEEYKIQIIFSTHSPTVLKAVNKLQREEIQRKGVKDITRFDFDNQIVQLFPKYDNNGNRLIDARNINTSRDLKSTLNDMDLLPTSINQHINLYTEDTRSKILLTKILEYKGVTISDYVDIIDVDLGWTNYCQLINKKIPEFLSSLIVLDKDVEQKRKNQEQKDAINNANVMFMPIDVERGMFDFLKKHDVFNVFEEMLKSHNCLMSYDVCFSHWVENECSDSNEYKQWFTALEDAIPDLGLLYEFWCQENQELVEQFFESFKDTYNLLAEKENLDYLI